MIPDEKIGEAWNEFEDSAERRLLAAIIASGMMSEHYPLQPMDLKDPERIAVDALEIVDQIWIHQ